MFPDFAIAKQTICFGGEMCHTTVMSGVRLSIRNALSGLSPFFNISGDALLPNIGFDLLNHFVYRHVK